MAQPSVGRVIIILMGFGYSLKFASFTDMDTIQQEGSGTCSSHQPASVMSPDGQSMKK